MGVLEDVEREYMLGQTLQKGADLLQGCKADQEKTRMDLIPAWVLEALGRVLTYGAKKYAPDNWKQVAEGKDRYYSALLRHLLAWRSGESIDSESKLPHLWHVLCNVVFLVYFSDCTPPQMDGKI
jgi:hypothetical protein